MNRTHAFPVVTVRGTSYELGRQHGEQAAPLVERYLYWIERLTGLSRDVLCRNAMQFVPRLEALSPAFVEEIRGLADGAGISFDEAVLCQARAEAAHAPRGRRLHGLCLDRRSHRRRPHAGRAEPGTSHPNMPT